ILRMIESFNSHYIHPCGSNARAMWKVLCQAHEDSLKMFHCFGTLTTNKFLVTMKMIRDNVTVFRDKMHQLFKKLDALILSNNSLTTNNIFTVTLFVPFPPDWLPIITPLKQLQAVTSSRVVQALKAKAT
ncbi:hypothetical protein CROQUDRAFT_54504, partial [Cronartium quercuum f. sp. fusiforme G11]